MSIFSDIHRITTQIIPMDRIGYAKFVENRTNDFGIVEQVFEDVVDTSAHVQPGIVSSFGGSNIEMKDYKELGLDWSKRHITVWMTDRNLEPCCSQEGADKILYNGMEFTVIQVENWDRFNNWQRIYCVEKK